MKAKKCWWACSIVLGIAMLGLGSLDSDGGAAAQQVRQPFSNAVGQRAEMIRELKEIRSLLKEQNALLRQMSGKETR